MTSPHPDWGPETSTSGSALNTERKFLTALFVDLKDSTRMTQAVDIELWHECMDRFLRTVSECVEEFGGIVAQYMGDGAMALFGAPRAHEDHALRACHAAMRLRERIGKLGAALPAESPLEFVIRVGLNSGDVVVGKIGDHRHVLYTAQGLAVAVAARVESIARPGTIYMTRETASLVEGLVDLADRGETLVKNVDSAIHVYELTGLRPLRTRLDVARERGLSPLIGRALEVAQLEAGFQAASEGRSGAVLLVGDAGVGKSRLCREFVVSCRDRGVAVHEGHCVSHGASLAFLPLRQVFRDYFEVDGLSPEEARAKIRADTSTWAAGDDSALDLIFDLLGVPDADAARMVVEPITRTRRVAAFLRASFRERTKHKPIVLMIDDAHWIDEFSDALLAELVQDVAGMRVLLVASFRPERRPALAALDACHEMPLEPLTDADAARLLEHLLGTDDSVVPVAERVRLWTRGNPFFIEEVVHSFLQAGLVALESRGFRLLCPAESVVIPPTVHGVIAARVDRLDPTARRVLGAASVMGTRMARDILERVTDMPADELDRALAALVSVRMLHVRSHRQERYEFDHPLIQEVAYGSQVARDRKRLHGAVAEALVAARPEDLDRNAGLIAYHWEQAGHELQAARWHARAADWQSVVNSGECLQHWGSVRTLLAATGDLPEAIALGLRARVNILNLGWRLGVDEADAERLVREGRALAERNGDVRSLAMLLNHHAAVLHSSLGHSGRTAASSYAESAREAWRLAHATDDADVKVTVAVNRLYSLFLAGRVQQAHDFLESVLDGVPADDRVGVVAFGFSPVLWIRSFRGQLLSFLGRTGEAESALQAASAVIQERGEIENLGWLEGFAATRAWVTGDGRATVAHARAALDIAEASGSAFSRILAYKWLGSGHALCERWQDAAEALETALRILRHSHANVLEEASVLARLAEVRARLGAADEAEALARTAIEVARRHQASLFECEAELALAAILLGRGATQASALTDCVERARQLVVRTGATAFWPVVTRYGDALGDAWPRK